MKTTYLVWKDPACGGNNPDWREISGKEFYVLVNSEESKSRHFIRLHSTEPGGSDGEIVMESTAEVYRDWKKDKRHREYLRGINPGYTEISYHALEGDDGVFGEELLRDEGGDPEVVFFNSIEPELLRMALAQLNDNERQLMEYLYLSEKPGTVRDFEAKTGVSKSAANRWRS